MIDIILIFLLTLFIYHWWTIKPKNFPPGPPCIPLLGSITFVHFTKFYSYFEKAREKYGPVIGLKFFTKDFVAFCGPKEVQDAFKIDDLQGRPDMALVSKTAVKGILLTEGPFWSTQRGFTVRHLKDFGFGKAIIEGLILDEIEEFFDQVLRKKPRIKPNYLFNSSVINVLWAIMAGSRHSHDDKNFKILLEALNETFRNTEMRKFTTRARRFLKKAIFNVNETPYCEKILTEFIEKTVAEHKKTLGDIPRDFIDAYLMEINKNENPDFNHLSLVSICMDLFAAGAESVGNTLSFCIMYMVLYPEIQKELQQEIDEVIGKNSISLQDKPRLHKLEAFLSEVQRMNTIAPLALPRRAMKDVQYNGYHIRENTFIIISIWCLLRDKEHWGDPDNFRPNRFINSEGKYVKDEWLSVFGLGKRYCPGESLARQILFLFLASLIKEFEFSTPPGHPKPDTEALPGITTAPKPFEVDIKTRE